MPPKILVNNDSAAKLVDKIFNDDKYKEENGAVVFMGQNFEKKEFDDALRSTQTTVKELQSDDSLAYQFVGWLLNKQKRPAEGEGGRGYGAVRGHKKVRYEENRFDPLRDNGRQRPSYETQIRRSNEIIQREKEKQKKFFMELDDETRKNSALKKDRKRAAVNSNFNGTGKFGRFTDFENQYSTAVKDHQNKAKRNLTAAQLSDFANADAIEKS